MNTAQKLRKEIKDCYTSIDEIESEGMLKGYLKALDDVEELIASYSSRDQEGEWVFVYGDLLEKIKELRG